jgi:hypothetical protein
MYACVRAMPYKYMQEYSVLNRIDTWCGAMHLDGRKEHVLVLI